MHDGFTDEYFAHPCQYAKKSEIESMSAASFVLNGSNQLRCGIRLDVDGNRVFQWAVMRSSGRYPRGGDGLLRALRSESVKSS